MSRMVSRAISLLPSPSISSSDPTSDGSKLVMDVIYRMETLKEWEDALAELFEEWKGTPP
jgi:hypothetical protein